MDYGGVVGVFEKTKPPMCGAACEPDGHTPDATGSQGYVKLL